MRSRSAAGLAWSLFALTALCVGFALLVASASPPVFKPLSVRVHVWAIVLLGVAFLIFAAVGAFVAARIPANTVGWLFLSIGLCVCLALASIAYVETTLPGRPWAEVMSDLSSVAVFPQIAFVLLLFPDGRLVSPRWRWAALTCALTALAFLASMFTPYAPPDRVFRNPIGLEALRGTILEAGALAWGLLPVTMLASVASFVVRFRASTGHRRQQLKWFALAAGLAGVGFLTWLASWGALDRSVFHESWDATLTAGGIVVFVVCLTALPIASGVAILRYRLYDVDTFVNRTLVYGALTAVLGAVYLAGTLVPAALLGGGGGRNSVFVAASTLATASLFRPARARIQAWIDRRFYRRKYDATKTLEAFSARLRDEVDLDAMAGQLVGVVGATMQPRHVSLWLRGPGGSTPARGTAPVPLLRRGRESATR